MSKPLAQRARSQRAATALAGAAALAASSEAYAHTVYSGIVDLDLPYTTGPIARTPWDVNGDGIQDFELVNAGTFPRTYRYPSTILTNVWVSGSVAANQVQSFESTTYYYYDDIYLGPLVYPTTYSFLDQLSPGEIIRDAVDTSRFGSFFIETNLALRGSGGFYDPEGWEGATGLFGFRFEAADGTHFGWGRASLEIQGTPEQPVTVATLHDWAYETVPDQSIKAASLPEPGTGTFLLVGLGAAGVAEHRRRRRARGEASETAASS